MYALFREPKVLKFILFWILLSFFTSCFGLKQKKEAGNSIVNKIEEYRSEYDSLPNSLREMGLNDVVNDVLFCYEKVDSTNYIVWFGTTLGEGVYYYSDTKLWENRLRKIGD